MWTVSASGMVRSRTTRVVTGEMSGSAGCCVPRTRGLETTLSPKAFPFAVWLGEVA